MMHVQLGQQLPCDARVGHTLHAAAKHGCSHKDSVVGSDLYKFLDYAI